MSERSLEAIVVPYDVERDDTGSARGPRELLARGFLDILRNAGWKVHETPVWSRREGGAKPEVVAELARSVARAVASAGSRQRFPLVLSGGCLSAVGVVTGIERLGRDLGIVWIDAHGDFNTPESTPSGYWDGMSLAAVCGRSLPEVFKAVELRPVHFRNVVHLAGRDFDPPEVEDFSRLNVAVVPPEAICEERTLQEIRRITAGKDLYLHVDLDGIDPTDAPAVSFPVPKGPRLDDVLRCLEVLARPAAMTFSSMSFDKVDEEGGRRMVDTCVRLVEAFAARS
ncbi:MAG TPA: arginase family protein [Thermoanaerobaculia bacterium]|nr:arginase family protein [Thermoanaerobaculia bacterium]